VGVGDMKDEVEEHVVGADGDVGQGVHLGDALPLATRLGHRGGGPAPKIAGRPSDAPRPPTLWPGADSGPLVLLLTTVPGDLASALTVL